MPKGYKIKRYRKIYRRGPSPVRVVLTCIMVAVLAFVGWNLYGPVSEYLLGTLTQEPDTSQTSANVSSTAAGEQPSPSQPDSTAEPEIPKEVRAIYLPISIISDPAGLDNVLNELAKTEINAVLFDLKNTAGNVLYQSRLDLVTQAESQTADAYDLAALCKKLEERHILPIGWLHAFRDPIAPAHITDAGVKYQNTEMLWLDNSRELGGKPWLNPYSDLAQAYITDIASEAVSMGVQRIMLDDFSFPTGYGQELAGYGLKASSVTRSDALSAFLQSIEKEVTAIGGELNLYISGLSALGVNSTYYGSNPLALANGNVTLGVMPAQFRDGYTQEGFTLETPVLQPKETVEALLKFLAPDLAGKEITAVLQAYPADYTIKNNKMYTADDINKQISACTENGVNSYIVYSPDANYPS